MIPETYPAARIVAPKVHAHFRDHLESARHRGLTDLAPLPDTMVIERLISAMFWASLRREEGYVPKISLAYAAPSQGAGRICFERALSLEPAALAKVAPIVERAGIHLGVW